MSTNPLFSDQSTARINALAAAITAVLPEDGLPSEVSLAISGVLVRYVAMRVESATDLDKAVDVLHRGLDLIALGDRQTFFGEQSDPEGS